MREKMELTMHMEKNKLVNQIRTAIFKSEFCKKYLKKSAARSTKEIVKNKYILLDQA